MIDDDHHGIRCLHGHHLCPGECSDNYVKMVLTSPEVNIPCKCMMGNHGIIQSTLERNMSADKLGVFMKYQSMHVVGLCKEGEELVHCPYCNYFEIHENGSSLGEVYCRGPQCLKVSCKHCKEENEI
eukprot:UN04002